MHHAVTPTLCHRILKYLFERKQVKTKNRKTQWHPVLFYLQVFGVALNQLYEGVSTTICSGSGNLNAFWFYQIMAKTSILWHKDHNILGKGSRKALLLGLVEGWFKMGAEKGEYGATKEMFESVLYIKHI